MRIDLNEPELFKKLLEQTFNKQMEFIPKGITIDSRLHKPGDVFIPISGEKFNGYDFISEICKNNPSLIISEKDIGIESPLLKVKNNREFIREIVGLWRKKLDTKIIGITGSNGKTTTKDLAHHVISTTLDCFKTDKNYNTVLSSPLSFLSAKQSQNVALIEMGTNQPGEIKSICEVFQPNIGLITNISNAHIENFYSINDIANEKGYLFKCLPKDGIAIINNDDPLINKLQTNSKKVSYGFKGNPNYFGYLNNDDQLTINNTSICLPSSGITMAQNTLAVFALADIIGIPKNYIIEKIENFELPVGRGRLIDKNGISIIDDTYNANPVSMFAGLNKLINKNTNRKIAILGDMFELGDSEKESHESIGKFLITAPIDIVILTGIRMKFAYNLIRNKKNSFWFETKDQIVEFLNSTIEKGDLLYIKGSRSMSMEKIIEKLD